MERWSLTAWANLGAILLSASLTQSAPPAVAAPVNTEKAACDLTKDRVAAQRGFPVSRIAFCDAIVPEEQPNGFYVLGLHSKRDDCVGDVCGSTLMGWFAVQRATSQVFEWDVANWKLGRPVKAGP